MAGVIGSKRVVPATVDFVDIAGLVRGASAGEGLGNQFLGYIRECDAIAHVVRCFEDENVHVHAGVDPKGDIETIDTELLLADLARSSGVWNGSGVPPRAATPDSGPRRPSWNGYATISPTVVPRGSTRRRRHWPKP